MPHDSHPAFICDEGIGFVDEANNIVRVYPWQPEPDKPPTKEPWYRRIFRRVNSHAA